MEPTDGRTTKAVSDPERVEHSTPAGSETIKRWRLHVRRFHLRL